MYYIIHGGDIFILNLSDLYSIKQQISLADHFDVYCFRDKNHLVSFQVYIWWVSMFASVSRKQLINNEHSTQNTDITG